MSAKIPRLLVFDTETTGLTLHPNAQADKQPKIIEFGGVVLCLKTGEVLEEFDYFVDPEEPISLEINKITGITDAMVAGHPNFPEIAPVLRRLFEETSGICAHNLPFDRDMVRWELHRHRNAVAAQHWPWPPIQRQFCTMNMYHPVYGKNPKLVNLYEDVTGNPYVQKHRALDDVKLMVEIIQKEKLWEVMK